MLRAVIIEELNFLNWEKKIPGFPEKHAGIIIEGGASKPRTFLRCGYGAVGVSFVSSRTAQIRQ